MSIHAPHVGSTWGRRLAEHHREAKARRDLDRAIANAPTQESRHELLVISGR
jgi:hypothetical protein